MNRILASASRTLPAPILRLWNEHVYSAISTNPSKIPRSLRHTQRRFDYKNWHPRHLLSLPHALVVVWVVVLLWGERWVFRKAVEECEWGSWERWVGLLLSLNLLVDSYLQAMYNGMIGLEGKY